MLLEADRLAELDLPGVDRSVTIDGRLPEIKGLRWVRSSHADLPCTVESVILTQDARFPE